MVRAKKKALFSTLQTQQPRECLRLTPEGRGLLCLARRLIFSTLEHASERPLLRPLQVKTSRARGENWHAAISAPPSSNKQAPPISWAQMLGRWASHDDH